MGLDIRQCVTIAMAKRNEQTASKYNNMLSASSFLDLKAELSSVHTILTRCSSTQAEA